MIPITIKKVYGKVRQDRWGVVVAIEYKGNVFEWLPTYADLETLKTKLIEVEILNKDYHN